MWGGGGTGHEPDGALPKPVAKAWGLACVGVAACGRIADAESHNTTQAQTQTQTQLSKFVHYFVCMHTYTHTAHG